MEKLIVFFHKVATLPRRYLGVLVGILFWLLILFFGFFPTLLLAVFVAIGYSVGKFVDDRANVQEFVHRLLQTDRFE